MTKRLLGLIILVVFTIIAFSSILQAQSTQPASSKVRFVPPPPPHRGIPSGRQRGGASRGNCPVVDQPLTAIVPAKQENSSKKTGNNPDVSAWESVWGLTTASHPTFWFYVPHRLTPKFPLEFALLDERGNIIYKTSLSAVQPQPSFINISLPATAAPLEVGKMYHWYFLINCDRDAPPLVEGWVQRVAVHPTLKNQLQQASPIGRVALYAANGIWYDALTTLAEMRRANSQDPSLTSNWMSLLDSIGLVALASQPLGFCCTPTDRVVGFEQ